MEKEKNVGIYARVSTEEQVSGMSLSAQLEKCRQYCQIHGWKVAKEYIEEGKSGYYLEREKIRELLNDCEAGLINVVLVYKLDRLSRNLRDILLLVDEKFRNQGVDFVSISENFDSTSYYGRFFFHIIGALAEFERNMIRERVILGMDKKARDGWALYKAPMGYRYKDGRLIVKEDEAQKVRKIFQDYIRHRNLRKVARIHNLDAKKVQRIISNESYLGLVKWKGERIRGTHQPIIDSETFEKARKIMNERK